MSKNNIKIIFIDIDGVILPLSWHNFNNDVSMKYYYFLKELVDNNVKIIISSTRRYDLIELFDWWYNKQWLPIYAGNIDLNKKMNNLNAKRQWILDMINSIKEYNINSKNMEIVIIDDQDLCDKTNKYWKKLDSILKSNKWLFIQPNWIEWLNQNEMQQILNYFNINSNEI